MVCTGTQIFGPKLNKYDIFDLTWPRPFQKYIIYIVNFINFQIARKIMPIICCVRSIFGPSINYLAPGLEYLGPATWNMTYLIQPHLDLFKKYPWYCQLLYLKCLANICFLVNIWPQDSNILPHDYLGTACQIWHIWSSLTLTITQINNLCCQFGLPPNFVKYLLFSANIWPRTQIFGYMAQIFGHSPVKYDIFDPAWPRPFQLDIDNLLAPFHIHSSICNWSFCSKHVDTV